MNPFFFGPSTHPLYGVYHPPTSAAVQQEGILLLPAFGQEYMRAHRAYRQLANLLNKKGFPVLRFDYRGTGDSAGELADVHMRDWLDDISLAAEELRTMAQVTRISAVGLRMGALLAGNAKEDFTRLCLWDPVISGESYDNELLASLGSEGPAETNHVDEQGTLHYNGFPLSAEFRNEMKHYDLCQTTPRAQQVYHVSSKHNDDDLALSAAWSELPAYRYEHVPVPGHWTFVDEFGGILLPQAVIQAIVAQFESKGVAA